MNRNPHRSIARTALRRGLGAAGAAVAVAFVGAAGVGASEAQAAGVSAGVTYLAHPTPLDPVPATHPANLQPATTAALRYSFENGELRSL
ncbi:MAG: hypothetical protein ABIQ53_01375 [Terracoccus sp.]